MSKSKEVLPIGKNVEDQESFLEEVDLPWTVLPETDSRGTELKLTVLRHGILLLWASGVQTQRIRDRLGKKVGSHYHLLFLCHIVEHRQSWSS